MRSQRSENNQPRHDTSRGIRRYLLTPEAAQHLRVSPVTLAKWRAIGVGPPWRRLGTRVVYELTEIDAWADAQRSR